MNALNALEDFKDKKLVEILKEPLKKLTDMFKQQKKDLESLFGVK